MESALITVPTAIPMVALVGPNDAYLRILESTFTKVIITVRGNEIFVKGDLEESAALESLIKELLVLLRGGQALTIDSVERAVTMVKHIPQDHN
jgi:phosphate starvation-inducible PhoH-like protein